MSGMLIKMRWMALLAGVAMPVAVVAEPAASTRTSPPGPSAKARARAQAQADASARARVHEQSAALGMGPAETEYLANDAPFVVFDVAPRRLVAGTHAPAAVELRFLALASLSRVDVRTFTPARYLPVRIACGSQVPGYWQCAVPAPDAQALLDNGHARFGLRIEAEGLDGERSVVQVLLPVGAAGAREQTPPPAGVARPPGAAP